MPITRHPLLQQLQRLATERWTRQALRTLLQATSVSIGVWCIGLGASLLWRWPINLTLLTAVSLAVIGVALLTLLRKPMSPAEVARRLDRRFQLNEQLATAVEVVYSGAQPSPVVEKLLERSGRTIGGVRQHVRQRQRTPWTDLLTFLALLIVAAGLFLLSGISGFNTTTLATTLPALPQASDPNQQFPEEAPLPIPGVEQAGGPGAGETMAPAPGEMPGQAQQANGPAQGAAADPQTLEALANALRDQGATRPAADALDRGDTAQAAQSLRELADQADSLSEQARQALAESLRDAARDISSRDPALANQLRESARELENEASAAQGLEDLAQAIDQLGESSAEASASEPAPGTASAGEPQAGQQGEQPGNQPGQQGADGEPNGPGQQANQGSAAGNNPSEQRPITPAGRLGVEGQPVELEAEGGGQTAEGQNNPETMLQGSTGSTSGSQTGVGGAIGADPLRIPLDERDVVQGYFQP